MDLSEKIKTYYQKIKEFIVKYERHLSSGALVFGFIVDSLTLQRIDLFLENAVLVSYILIAMASITILHFIESGMFARLPKASHAMLVIALQFAFGGLASAFLIFYSRSADIYSSWPFLLLLVAYLVGNELLKKRYAIFWFRLGVFFFVLNSYFIFLIPVISGKIGDVIFVSSGVLSIGVMALFILALSKIKSEWFAQDRKKLYAIIGGIFFTIQCLYFLNFIPPIPLALKDSGIYHNVSRLADGRYQFVNEEREKGIFDFFDFRDTVHFVSGGQMYAFSSIFAPTRISTEITHEWQRWSEIRGEWATLSRVRLPVSGGREGGYRTFSINGNMIEGKWRVNVRSQTGALIGRIRFDAKKVSVPMSEYVFIR